MIFLLVKIAKAKANLVKANPGEQIANQEQKVIALANNNPKFSDNKRDEISGSPQIIPGRSNAAFRILTADQ